MEDGPLRRIGWATVALASFILLQSLCFQHPSWVVLGIIEGLLVLAALRPFEALLVFAGLGPLSTMFLAAARDAAGGTRFVEALALAFIAGACANAAASRSTRPLPPSLVWSTAVLGAAALASAVIQSAVLHVEQPALSLGGEFPIVLVRDYLLLPNAVARSVQFVEGLLLLLVVLHICEGDATRHARVVRMLVAAAAAVAAFNVLRLLTVAMAQEHFWQTTMRVLTTLRINIHYPDRNAAGSYFAMMLVIALAAGWRRPARYALPAAMIAAALWLSGSRTAFAAAAIGAIALVAIELRRRGTRPAAAAVVVTTLVVLVAAGWTWYPAERNDSAAFSLSTRLALSGAGLRMATEHPVFGVGVSRYYELSDDYAGDLLRSFGGEHENAHNYFVQVLAELGIPAFLVFAAVLTVALRRAWPSADAPVRAWGPTIGLIVYLLTCLGGHPLITPEAAYPFWIALGLAASTSAMPAARAVGWRPAAIAAIVLLVASVPIRAADAVRHARLENTTIGMSLTQRDPDNMRYRWSEARSTFYVSAAATAVTVPLRLGPAAPGPLSVRIMVNGREADRQVVSSRDQWQRVRFLAPQGVRAEFVRIDIEVAPAATLVPDHRGEIPRVFAVGQPIVMWDADAPLADVPFLGDLDGDRRADLVVWSAETGRWRWLTSSHQFEDVLPGTSLPPDRRPGGLPVVGDLDGDGRVDLAIWRGSTATWEWLESSSGYRSSAARTIGLEERLPGDVPLIADVDGDHRNDLVLWRSSARKWVWRTAASGFASGGSSDAGPGGPVGRSLPLAGHAGPGFGGDAIGLWTALPSGGARLEWLRAGAASAAPLQWQDRKEEDEPLLADLDRDGRLDVIAWRPTLGLWASLRSSTAFAPSAEHQWGNGPLGDVPLAGDVDGDGAADLVVWRASTRTWFWLTSESGYDAKVGRLKPWKY